MQPFGGHGQPQFQPVGSTSYALDAYGRPFMPDGAPFQLLPSHMMEDPPQQQASRKRARSTGSMQDDSVGFKLKSVGSHGPSADDPHSHLWDKIGIRYDKVTGEPYVALHAQVRYPAKGPALRHEIFWEPFLSPPPADPPLPPMITAANLVAVLRVSGYTIQTLREELAKARAKWAAWRKKKEKEEAAMQLDSSAGTRNSTQDLQVDAAGRPKTMRCLAPDCIKTFATAKARNQHMAAMPSCSWYLPSS